VLALLIRSDRPESDRNPHVETLPYPHRRDAADRAFQFHRFTHTTNGLYPSPLTRVVRCQIGGKRALARLADLRLLPCVSSVYPSWDRHLYHLIGIFIAQLGTF
jgi:hypothetical protein